MKKLLLLVMGICSITLGSFINVSGAAAADIYIGPTMKGFSDAETESAILPGNVKYHKDQAAVIINGDIAGNAYGSHTYQYVEADYGDSAVKTITWSAGTNDEWTKATVRSTMADFEARNPGWIAVAGINGDFFMITSTYEPCDNFVQNGDVYKPQSLKGNPDIGVVGFKDDNTYITGNPNMESKPTLKVVSGGDKSIEYTVDAWNKLSETGISVYDTNYENMNLDTTGKVVYEGQYSIRRTSGGYGFVRGDLTAVNDNIASITEVPLGKFYIIAPEALEGIGSDMEVKVEYSLTGEFADVQSTMGYRYQTLKDGVSQFANTKIDYIGERGNPRSIIGFKENGIVLMTIDGRGKVSERRESISGWSGAEIMRYVGCTDAYNLDGGGSVTLVIKDYSQPDTFRCVNRPSDGNERPIGNAVLLVMRDTNLEVENMTHSGFDVVQTAPIADGTMSNVKVMVDGTKEFPMENGKAQITGLLKGEEYNVQYVYDITDTNGVTKTYKDEKFVIKTSAYEAPIIDKFEFDDYDKGAQSAEFDFKLSDDDEKIESAYIEYNGFKYDLEGTRGSCVVENIDPAISNKFRLVVEYSNDAGELCFVDQEITVDEIVPEVTTPEPTTPPKEEPKGCNSSTALYMATVSLLGVAFMKLRKK